jgi:hypothetical protein
MEEDSKSELSDSSYFSEMGSITEFEIDIELEKNIDETDRLFQIREKIIQAIINRELIELTPGEITNVEACEHKPNNLITQPLTFNIPSIVNEAPITDNIVVVDENKKQPIDLSKITLTRKECNKMGVRKCPCCNKWYILNKTNFYQYNRIKYGVYYTNYCRPCSRDKSREKKLLSHGLKGTKKGRKRITAIPSPINDKDLISIFGKHKKLDIIGDIKEENEANDVKEPAEIDRLILPFNENPIEPIKNPEEIKPWFEFYK